MHIPSVKSGDILLYWGLDELWYAELAVKTGEILEDGVHSKMYHHSAIALNDKRKVEADGHFVAIHNITYNGTFDVYRPPIPRSKVDWGLAYVATLVGQRYNWWYILDDALRFITKNKVHLPVKFIDSTEQRMKICNTVIAKYLQKTGFIKNISRLRSPEDVALLLKPYQVEAGKR